MKNAWLTLILILSVSLSSHAQVERSSSSTTQGTILMGTTVDLTGCQLSMLSDVPNNVGISIGSSKYKSDDHEGEGSSYTVFNVSPNVGFFATDNVLVGANLSFTYYKEETMDDPITFMGFGPFVRYYYPLKSLSVFGQVGALLGQTSLSSDNKMNTTHLGVGVGTAIFVNDKVSLDIMAGFNHMTAKDKDTENNARYVDNVFGLSFGFSVFL